MERKVELLSPARDIKVGMAAIDNGADAVYIGASAFGARKAAGNSLEDLQRLVDYAHRFYCRVFVTLNTVLYDHELPEAERLAKQLYAMGVDALIVQDMGMLKLDLPPISLHASTQMHNYDLDRIRFLDRIGFQRIVLARELSLEQIREIRREVKAELEVFVHGALCVSLSGQCYLSQHMFGRSANRGECAQPCRMKWNVEDSNGKLLVRDKYVLSLKDLNLSAHIRELIDAGVDSLKIEGRLKDETYVSNVTNHYSSLVGTISGVNRVGSGKVVSGFESDPERSFNRGYSDYFAVERKRGLINMDSPKSTGKKVGVVREAKGKMLQIDAAEEIHNGDGLCYLDNGELKGIRVNSADGNRLTCNEAIRIAPGTVLFRNYDHQFVTRLEKGQSVRRIGVTIEAEVQEGRIRLTAADEDGITAEYSPEESFEEASDPRQAERFRQQLAKCGDTVFACTEVRLREGDKVMFVPAASANAMRRCLLDLLVEEREKQREVIRMDSLDPKVSYDRTVDWHHNVVNRSAARFYEEHGAGTVEDGFEKNPGVNSPDLMRTRYCLLYELGRCRKQCRNEDVRFPLFLCNDKHRFRLEFDCEACFMRVTLPAR